MNLVAFMLSIIFITKSFHFYGTCEFHSLYVANFQDCNSNIEYIANTGLGNLCVEEGTISVIWHIFEESLPYYFRLRNQVLHSVQSKNIN